MLLSESSLVLARDARRLMGHVLAQAPHLVPVVSVMSHAYIVSYTQVRNNAVNP